MTTPVNPPSPEEATHLLQENQNRRQQVGTTSVPTWLWVAQCVVIAASGVSRDIWEGNSWSTWLLLIPLAVLYLSQNRWVGARMGLQMAPHTLARGGAVTPWNRSRLLGTLSLAVLMIAAAVAATRMEDAGVEWGNSIAWSVLAVLLIGAWPLVRRLYYGPRHG
ncbi:hypothetical protein [Kineosporia babensis]|uniref:Uncharacterized protein n=1 Tax=Kineosporia babensis TaxID=499548 RepID=A0A9X1NCN3_9ACTN|nr:hypothetical protein [Kineosporia babensis]MCD5311326.1 hypothetical protein [Kineosporia babensis]